MKVAAINGSLGAVSSNGAALSVAVEHLGRLGVDAVVIGELEHIPAFLPDTADDPPPRVRALAGALHGCDALMIAAPEYAGGLSGAVKNALDWQVGMSSLYHRPVAVLSSGTTGGPFAVEQLVRTLSWQGALVVATLGVAAPRTKMTGDRFTDQATLDDIAAWADHLVAAAAGDATARLDMVTTIVSRYGIDPARFGDLITG